MTPQSDIVRKEFEHAQHDLWLSGSHTKMILQLIEQVKSNLVQIAIDQSGNRAISNLEIRDKLLEARSVENIINLIKKGKL